MRPKKAYDDQVRHAEDRGIPWLFTYAEWLEMWLLSGQWESRGKEKGQYQMCRRHDLGAYSFKNCSIETVEDNQRERHKVGNKRALEVILAYQNSDKPQWQIAQDFNITQSSVSRIVNRNRRVD